MKHVVGRALAVREQSAGMGLGLESAVSGCASGRPHGELWARLGAEVWVPCLLAWFCVLSTCMLAGGVSDQGRTLGGSRHR